MRQGFLYNPYDVAPTMNWWDEEGDDAMMLEMARHTYFHPGQVIPVQRRSGTVFGMSEEKVFIGIMLTALVTFVGFAAYVLFKTM